MQNLEKPIKMLIKEKVNHQNIGGKEIIIEKEGTLDYLLDRNIRIMTIAEANFITRRMDLFVNYTDEECSKIKLYYGHVDNLGYFVSEDEVESTIKKECPNCGKEIIGYPAISRKDNKTEICSKCGAEEAMQAFNDFYGLK